MSAGITLGSACTVVARSSVRVFHFVVPTDRPLQTIVARRPCTIAFLMACRVTRINRAASDWESHSRSDRTSLHDHIPSHHDR